MTVQPEFDLTIENGLLFDGRGGSPVRRNVGIRDGIVVSVQEGPFLSGQSRRRVDATGRWVMPGFIDLHTHYDAELEVSPSLSESVRHGVTTVFMGSCSLGAS